MNWPIWERHTKGDEIVVVLDGAGEFIQDIDGEHLSLSVEKGSAIINPQGVWHTANIESPMTAMFITPADGTEDKDR